MATLYVFCGLPGCGKSTYANSLVEYGNNVYIASSDNLREELYGDINDQLHNAEVFQELYKRASYHLENGTDVIIDATNTTIKSRRNIFNSGIDFNKHEAICVIFDTPFEECVRRDSLRARNVGKEVIEKFYKSYQIPFMEEGWTNIIFIGETEENNNIDFFFEQLKDFDQKTKWHNLTLDKHSEKVSQLIDDIFFIKERGTSFSNVASRLVLLNSALIHDYGKLFTQTFDENGEAHYYNHANIGTYELLSSGYRVLEVLFYINYHMLPFNWNSEKTINKYNNIFGVEKTSNLLLLNECDRKGK